MVNRYKGHVPATKPNQMYKDNLLYGWDFSDVICCEAMIMALSNHWYISLSFVPFSFWKKKKNLGKYVDTEENTSFYSYVCSVLLCRYTYRYIESYSGDLLQSLLPEVCNVLSNEELLLYDSQNCYTVQL